VSGRGSEGRTRSGARDAAPRPCDNCGARRTVAGARHCAFCGALLREPPAAPPSPFGDVEARFAALREHRSFERVLAERPPATAGVWPGVLLVGFGVVFAAAPVAMGMRARAMHEEFQRSWAASGGGPLHDTAGPLESIPYLFALIGVCIALYGVYRIVRFQTAQWESFAALVVDERTDVSGSGSSGAQTRYYVTLEQERGSRREYRTTGNMAGGVRPGDLGVAHTRDGMLLGFRRLHG